MRLFERVNNLRDKAVETINPAISTPLCLMKFLEGKLPVPYNYDGEIFLYDAETFASRDDQWIMDHLIINAARMSFGRLFGKGLSEVGAYEAEKFGIMNIEIDDSFNRENLPSIGKLLDNEQMEFKPWIRLEIKKRNEEAIEGMARYNSLIRTQSGESVIVPRYNYFYAWLKNGKWVQTSSSNKKVKELIESHRIINKLADSN